MSQLDPDLIQAYRETHFVVLAQDPFTLRVGQRSEELLALHREVGVESSAYVTACNPFSRSLSAAENEARMAELRTWLREAGHPTREGIGKDPAGEWPGEPSVLVLGLTRADSEALGRRLEQNAVVFMASDAMPELLLLR